MSRTCFDCANYDENSQGRCELDSEDRRACFHYNLVYYRAKDVVKSNKPKSYLNRKQNNKIFEPRGKEDDLRAVKPCL